MTSKYQLFIVLTYIDPGIGSALIQAIIAGTIGFFYAIKLYGARVKKIFKRKKENDT
jgi:hypothetical protein